MSKRVGDTFVICGEPDGKCELCGKKAELRPYGPNGERVCFECGMKDEESAKRQFKKAIDEQTLQLINQPTLTNEFEI